MSSYLLSVPSKTFLVGEYSALANGPAIILNTFPRFQLNLEYRPEKDFYINPIENNEDPLYRFWEENSDYLLDFDSSFIDPYEGAGGLGASSAEWSMYYFFSKQYLPMIAPFFDHTKSKNNFLQNLDFSFIEEFLSKYRSYSKEKFPPSGYDIISQWIGKIAYVDIENRDLKKMDWPFNNLSFVLIKSGKKIKTHEHLKNISSIPKEKFSPIVECTLKSFYNKDEELFFESINDYAKALEEEGLVGTDTKALLNLIKENPMVLAIKGCGALGADVFCAIVHTSNKKVFMDYVLDMDLRIVATESQISHGIEVESKFESLQIPMH